MQEFSRSKKVVLSASACLILFVTAGALTDRLYARNDTYQQLHNFNDTLDHIKKHYVDTVDASDVIYGGRDGLLESLDPYCAYLKRDMIKRIGAGRTLTATRSGLVLSKRNGYCVVVAALPGSPAEKAAIQPRDYIRYIEDHSTRRLSVYEAIDLLDGPPGSEVTLKLLNSRNYENTEITLKSDSFPLPGVTSTVLPEGFGLLKIPIFDEQTPGAVEEHLKKLQAGGAKGIIVDLRGNALGGLVDAVRTADLFLGSGDLLSVRGKARLSSVLARLGSLKPQVEKPSDDGLYSLKIRSKSRDATGGVPLVVLVNHSTAEGAEAFAAIMEDRHRAEVIGVGTFGVGSMQEVIPLSDGASLVLTVAKFYRMNGEAIQGKGIEPSRKVQELSGKPGEGLADDPFIRMGIEVLQGDGSAVDKAA